MQDKKILKSNAQLNWHKLNKKAIMLAKKLTIQKLIEKLLVIFHSGIKKPYIGFLVKYYKAKLKHEGVESLLNKMCSNSLNKIIIPLK